MVEYVYNLSIWETEAGESLQVQGQPGIHRPCLKKTNRNSHSDSYMAGPPSCCRLHFFSTFYLAQTCPAELVSCPTLNKTLLPLRPKSEILDMRFVAF